MDNVRKPAGLTRVHPASTVADLIADQPELAPSSRQARAEATYKRLFGPRDTSAPDPDLLEILRRFIFADVFDTGVLDDQTAS